MSTCDHFICELCMETVNELEPQIRLGADAVVQNPTGGYSSMMNNTVMVFAVFHNECIQVTLERVDCDDIPYIEEARALLTSLGTDAKIVSKETSVIQEPKVKRHLVCLQGGVRA